MIGNRMNGATLVCVHSEPVKTNREALPCMRSLREMKTVSANNMETLNAFLNLNDHPKLCVDA